MRAPTGAALKDAAAVLGVLMLVGIAGGVLWWLLVEPATFTKSAEGGAMGELELSKRFDADGWYTVIALVAGFLSGLGLSWWRSRDHLLTTTLLVAGSTLAAAASALVGRVLGPGETDTALEAARRGAEVPVELAVGGNVVYLAWPIAVLAGALMVLWSSPGSVEPGGADAAHEEPYGQNASHSEHTRR